MVYTIFLDIDGVLNSLDNQRSLESHLHSSLYNIKPEQYKELNANRFKYSLNGEGNYKFDERCKRHFNNVCQLIKHIDKNPKFQIVLTSAWQYMGIERFNLIWKEENMCGTVVDLINKYGSERGRGIQEYLKIHDIRTNWVSLDDDAFTYIDRIDAEDKFRVVIPNGNIGVNYENSKQLLIALTDKKYSNFLSL